MRHGHGPRFTHFGSIPFIAKQHRNSLHNLQNSVSQLFSKSHLDQYLKENNPNLFHLTLMMLFLGKNELQQKMRNVMSEHQKQIRDMMINTTFTAGKLGYFTRKPKYNSGIQNNHVNVIYLDLEEDEQYKRMQRLIDYLIRLFIKSEIIFETDLQQMNIEYDHNHNLFRNKKPHITLFRCEGLEEGEVFVAAFQAIQSVYEGQRLSVRTVDISTRFKYEESKFYEPLSRIEVGPKQEESK